MRNQINKENRKSLLKNTPKNCKNRTSVQKKTQNQILLINSTPIYHHNNVHNNSSKKPFKSHYHQLYSNRKFCYFFTLLFGLSILKEAGNTSIKTWCSITSLQMFLSRIYHKLKNKFLIVSLFQLMISVKSLDVSVTHSLNRSVCLLFSPLNELLETLNRNISKREELYSNH